MKSVEAGDGLVAVVGAADDAALWRYGPIPGAPPMMLVATLVAQ